MKKICSGSSAKYFLTLQKKQLGILFPLLLLL
jgi:hypothetical protein